MKNPFEFFRRKKELNSKAKPPEMDSYEKGLYPKISGEMHRDYGMVQLEFDMVNAAGVASLEEIHTNTIERVKHFGRAKIVLSFPISKDEFVKLSKKQDKDGSKEDFKKKLIDKLEKNNKILIERTPGSNHVFIQPNERHELKESISRVDKKYIWVFVFDNSEEDMVDKNKELKMVYSNM